MLSNTNVIHCFIFVINLVGVCTAVELFMFCVLWLFMCCVVAWSCIWLFLFLCILRRQTNNKYEFGVGVAICVCYYLICVCTMRPPPWLGNVFRVYVCFCMSFNWGWDIFIYTYIYIYICIYVYIFPTTVRETRIIIWVTFPNVTSNTTFVGVTSGLVLCPPPRSAPHNNDFQEFFVNSHKNLWRLKGLLEIIVSFGPDSLAIHMIPRDQRQQLLRSKTLLNIVLCVCGPDS